MLLCAAAATLAWLGLARLGSALLCSAWCMCGMAHGFVPSVPSCSVLDVYMYICSEYLEKGFGIIFFSLSLLFLFFFCIFFSLFFLLELGLELSGTRKSESGMGSFFLHPLFSFLFSPSLSLNQYSGHYRGKNRKKTIKANRQKLNYKQNERKKRK
ncbi:hypothetical protein M432DRAFT_291001 [Thermoascus aurantiacus ATCC 26904]